jgi:hypothetical protein
MGYDTRFGVIKNTIHSFVLGNQIGLSGVIFYRRPTPIGPIFSGNAIHLYAKIGPISGEA